MKLPRALPRNHALTELPPEGITRPASLPQVALVKMLRPSGAGVSETAVSAPRTVETPASSVASMTNCGEQVEVYAESGGFRNVRANGGPAMAPPPAPPTPP